MQPLTDQGWKGSDNIHADVELAAGVLRNAVNLDFMGSGKVRSRPGYALVTAGAVSNGFSFGKFLVYLMAGNLVAYNVETAASTTLFPVQGSKIGHTVIGSNLYVSDGVGKWVIGDDLTVSAWLEPTATDPTFDARYLAPFPPCVKLCHFNGRMFGAVGNVVIYSEPYAFGVYNPSRNFVVVPTKVTVLHANADALFVGADSLYAVTAVGVEGMAINTVMGIPVSDVTPAYDAETGYSFFPTTRGLMTIPARGVEVSLMGSDLFAVRPMAAASAGIIKRGGVTQIISTAVPDTSYMAEHPLVSADYISSENVRKELQDAL